MSTQIGVTTNNIHSNKEGLITMARHINKADKQFALKVEAIRALELSNRLHSTLNLDELFDMFTEESAKIVNFDHIQYQHPDNTFEFSKGTQKPHSCQYRLLIGGQNLGEINFTRTKKFTESETISLEYSITCLLNPLHNGLMYSQAIMNSLIDPLTSVKNRAAYDSSISREISLAMRYDNPLAMIILDIDHFKAVNDQYGHLFGDCVLRDVAQVIQAQIRDSDMVFRYGGEEFVILLSNTSETGALLLAERIRQAVSQLECNFNSNSTKVTVSQGIACLKDDETQDALFKRADDALYNAKDSGRNCALLSEI
jgi:diguanylate cyclase (GGDEF)-like protein